MDEKRKFFRIKNTGAIHASLETALLEVVEISSSGVVVIKKRDEFPPEGIIELSINNFSMPIKYHLLRIVKETMVLIFKEEAEINELFLILKRLRDEEKRLNEDKDHPLSS